MSLEHYRAIAARVTPTPKRPGRIAPGTGPRSDYRESLWAYIEWLEERLAFVYDHREDLFRDLSRERNASAANFNRWIAAEKKLAQIDLVLHPEPEAPAAEGEQT